MNDLEYIQMEENIRSGGHFVVAMLFLMLIITIPISILCIIDFFMDIKKIKKERQRRIKNGERYLPVDKFYEDTIVFDHVDFEYKKNKIKTFENTYTGSRNIIIYSKDFENNRYVYAYSRVKMEYFNKIENNKITEEYEDFTQEEVDKLEIDFTTKLNNYNPSTDFTYVFDNYEVIFINKNK